MSRNTQRNRTRNRRDQDVAVDRVRRELEHAEEARRRQKKILFAATGVAGLILFMVVAGGLRHGGADNASPSAPLQSVASAQEIATSPTAVIPTASPDPEPTVIKPDSRPAAKAPAAKSPAAKEQPEAKTRKNPGPARESAPEKKSSAKTATATAPQHFDIRIGAAGYEPSRVVATASSPIQLTVGKGEGCAAGFNMPSLGVSKDNSQGPVTLSLGKLKAGSYPFTCGMGMVSGALVVR